MHLFINFIKLHFSYQICDLSNIGGRGFPVNTVSCYTIQVGKEDIHQTLTGFRGETGIYLQNV